MRKDTLSEILERAVIRGVITDDQARAVLAAEGAGAGAEAPGAPRVPPVLEALGYLGAIFVIVGAVTLVSGSWDELESWSRLAILGGAAAALTATALAAGDERDPVRWRFRGFAGLLGSGALAGFAGVLASDALELGGEEVTLAVGAAVALHSGALWWWHERPAQHLACLGGLIAAGVGAVRWAGGQEGATGLVLWALGAAWLAASHRRLLAPALVGRMGGAATMLVAAGVTGGQWNEFSVVLGLATAATLVAAGIHLEQFVVTATGVVGTFIYLPATLGTFFGETVGVPAVMLLSGLGLLALTALLLRHRPEPGPSRGRGGWRPRARPA